MRGPGPQLSIAALAALGLTACRISHTPFDRRERQARFETEEAPLVEAAVVPETPAPAPPRRRRAFPPEAEVVAELGRKAGARSLPVEVACGKADCTEFALDKFFNQLDELDSARSGVVRVLHLGDSHIAADLITKTSRQWLQHRFGEAGRGFVVADQRLEYGGRRTRRRGWTRTRLIDVPRGKTAVLGAAGMSLESLRGGDRVEYQIDKGESEVTVYYLARRTGGRLRVLANEQLLGEIDAREEEEATTSKSFRLPRSFTARGTATLALVAQDPGIKIFGVRFETQRPGLLYESIGPVGADAKSYLDMDPRSFAEHIREMAPHLVILMLGGNDALAIRKGERTLAQVRGDFERLLAQVRRSLPEADCMVWSPMDAAEYEDGKLVSKQRIGDVRDMQRSAAVRQGCAFWDMYEAMGGESSFARWLKLGLVNEDLVHPRGPGGELLGHLFASALLDTYLADR